MKQFLLSTILILLLQGCRKMNMQKHSRQIIITVINECYADIKIYNLDGSIHTKESFDCDYEKEVYREIEEGKYKVIAESGNKKIEMYFKKDEFEARLNIEF